MQPVRIYNEDFIKSRSAERRSKRARKKKAAGAGASAAGASRGVVEVVERAGVLVGVERPAGHLGAASGRVWVPKEKVAIHEKIATQLKRGKSEKIRSGKKVPDAPADKWKVVQAVLVGINICAVVIYLCFFLYGAVTGSLPSWLGAL